MLERFQKFRGLKIQGKTEFMDLPIGHKFTTDEYFLEKMDQASALILDVLSGDPWMLGKRRQFSPTCKIWGVSL